MTTATICSEELTALKDMERAVSRQRAQLHRRIEYLRGTGAGDPETPQILASLEVEEREISSRRRALHAVIDTLDPDAKPVSRR